MPHHQLPRSRQSRHCASLRTLLLAVATGVCTALPTALFASQATCRVSQLQSLATWCAKRLACEGQYVKRPARDPDQTRLDRCQARTDAPLAKAIDRAVLKEARQGGQCRYSDAGAELAATYAPLLEADGSGWIETLLQTWTPEDPVANQLYGTLLSTIGTHCQALFASYRNDARKPSNEALENAVNLANANFLSRAQKAVGRAAQRGLTYAGSAPDALSAGTVSFVKSVLDDVGDPTDNGGAPGTPLVAAAIAAGGQHACAVLNNGALRCWGVNRSGQLGLGTGTTARGDVPNEMGDNLATVNVGTGLTVASVAAGNANTCALLLPEPRRLKCWGDNSGGQLGLGDTRDRGKLLADMGNNLPAIDLGANRSAVQVAIGATHACAVLDNGSLKCWGNNASGQLGLGDTRRRGTKPGEMGDALHAVNLGVARTAAQVVAGASHTCVLLDGGAVKCWGAGGNLGLGDKDPRGTTTASMTSLDTVSLGTGRTVRQLAAGLAFTCALLDDSTVKCWGDNSQGQLGQEDDQARGDEPNEMGDQLPPIDLGPGVTPVAIATGAFHACAVFSDGRLKCWGDNIAGQLGLGNSINRGGALSFASGDDPAPGDDLPMGDELPYVDLGSTRTVLGVALGYQFTCARLAPQALKCWGANAGQLGQGDTVQRGDNPDELGDNPNLPEIEKFKYLPPVDLGTE